MKKKYNVYIGTKQELLTSFYAQGRKDVERILTNLHKHLTKKDFKGGFIDLQNGDIDIISPYIVLTAHATI